MDSYRGKNVTEPIQAFISAGSNIGDRQANLESALEQLDRAGTVERVSPYFETEPVGYSDQPWFLNIAVQIRTRLSSDALLEICMEIEQSRGRTREFLNAPRTLDLDILFYGDSIIQNADLTVPHPRLHLRRFVLEPMAMIAPEFRHPLLHKSIRSLLDECRDHSVIRLYRQK